MSMQHAPAAQQPSAWSLILTLGGVAMLSGLLVVWVYQATLPRIEANRKAAIERAIFQVIPGAVTRTNFVISGEELTPAGPDAEGRRIYAGYDADGNLAGVAIEAAAQGYQDLIRVLYGYDPACQCIRGFTVLETRETPGLGDKIYKDAEFLRNFEALDGTLNSDGAALANAIVTVKHSAKREPWQIDAISGATVSSIAVGKALNSSAQQVFPLVMKFLDRLQRPPQSPEPSESSESSRSPESQ